MSDEKQPKRRPPVGGSIRRFATFGNENETPGNEHSTAATVAQPSAQPAEQRNDRTVEQPGATTAQQMNRREEQHLRGPSVQQQSASTAEQLDTTTVEQQGSEEEEQQDRLKVRITVEVYEDQDYRLESIRRDLIRAMRRKGIKVDARHFDKGWMVREALEYFLDSGAAEQIDISQLE